MATSAYALDNLVRFVEKVRAAEGAWPCSIGVPPWCREVAHLEVFDLPRVRLLAPGSDAAPPPSATVVRVRVDAIVGLPPEVWTFTMPGDDVSYYLPVG